LIANLNSLIDSLSLDHRRGAAEIVEDIAELLVSIAKVGVEDEEAAEQLFSRAVRRLANGQPSMAPVLNMLNRACAEKERAADDWEALRQSLEVIQEARKSQLNTMRSRIHELPKVTGTLLTFSNSSTVANLIITCRKNNWPERVICGEGRPIMEGLVMARRLTAGGVPVTVYTDAALMSHIVDADAVWVGGDSLCDDGLVNKIGSLALAIMAKTLDIPFISLMGLDKLLSTDMCPFSRFLPQNPREVASDDAEDLDVVNEYYEMIPLELVDYIFTEKGLARPTELLESIQEESTSRLFRSLARRSG